ncbi:MCE family protein [Rhodococcus sp. NPDC003318]|uniref:MCE family protein n=1 Tax=Rhodococcus sp. NPDC003318 TaxID=3364503 RepID=UPI0036739FD6
MRRTRRLTLAVACVLAGTGCGVGMQDLPLGRSADGPDYTVTLQLATAEGLMHGSDVRTGQRVIGRVAGLATDTVGAKVELSLEDATELPDNVLAAVELPSALGSPFIRLTPPPVPSSRPLQDGDVISESRTTIGPQIESMLATLGTIVTGSGLSQLQTVIEELNTAFSGRSGEVRGLTESMAVLLTKATENQDEFGIAIETAARISAQLTAQQTTVDSYLDALPDAVRALSDQRDSIATLLQSSRQLADTANTVVSNDPDGLGAMMSDASTVIATLASFNSEVGSMLDNMNTFLGNFGRSIHGDYLNFDGALDVPGSIDMLLTGGQIQGAAASNPVSDTAEDLTDLLRGGLR